MLKLLTTLTVCLALPFTVAAQNTHHKNHNDYKEWKTPTNRISCCDHTDCDIVKELGTDQNGNHIVRWRGQVQIVPERIWLKDQQSPDGNSHLCVTSVGPICYVPGNQMF